MRILTPSSTLAHCSHCGDPADGSLLDTHGNSFCCQGCRSVYTLLQEQGLGSFYQLGDQQAVKPREVDAKRYDHLDDAGIQALFFSYQDERIYKVSLRLPQIHCAACIYLLENIHRFETGVLRSEVDFLKKEAHLTVSKNALPFKALVIALAQLGYEPDLHHGLSSNDAARDEQKALLRRLAVAGFAFGNIMLMSFPEYLEAGGVKEPLLKSVMQTLNILLALPLLFYSGRSYFEQAWIGIKKRDLNIDIPIALGMVVLFVRSVYEIVSATGHGYLDSLAGLVFFLLIGRFFQQKTYDHLSFERDYRSFFPLGVSRKNKGGDVQEVPLSDLKTGDVLLIRNEEILPADAILNSDKTLVDYSFVTGESALQEKFRGDVLYAGGKISGPMVELEVIKEVSQGYLTRLWNHDSFQKSNRDAFKSITDRISRWFTPLVIALSIIGFAYWYPIDPSIAFQVFSAVLIVACPCALALSAPFTFGHAIRIFGRNGLFVKNTAVVDKLSQLRQIVFDKTGTLTQQEQGDIDLSGISWTAEQQQLVKTACQHSTHPLSRQLADAIDGETYATTDLYDEQKGRGIVAMIDGHEVLVGSAALVDVALADRVNQTSVYVRIDGELLGVLHFKNRYRSGIEQTVKSLGQRYRMMVLSGDNDQEKGYLTSLFGSTAALRFNQSPVNKRDAIEEFRHNDSGLMMMVGDGLNDAGALQSADIGVAVSEKSGQFTPASDAILDAVQLPALDRLVAFGRDTRKVIFTNLGLSLLYNVTGLSFALAGLMTPVISAILMPLSSITIVLNATLLTTYFARKNQLR